MDFLTRDELRNLIETQGEWCVSMFMPAVRAGSEVQQNPIRFKNLLRTAQDRLAQLGLRAPDVEEDTERFARLGRTIARLALVAGSGLEHREDLVD